MDATVVLILVLVVMAFFGASLFSISPYFVMYVLVSLMVVFQGTSRLNPTGTGRSVIFAIGSSLVFIFFGYRWFSDLTNKSKIWPPTINMCPDYLTFVPKITGSQSTTGGGCVDLLGVSNKDAGLVRTQQSELPTLNPTNTTKVFEYTSADVSAATNASSLQRICNRCQLAGVTWEGVYDGDSCIGLARWNIDQKNKDTCASS